MSRITPEQAAEEAINPSTTPCATEGDQPNPEWVRGTCPQCKVEPLVSNLYYVGGKGYLIRWECWGSLKESPTCDYRRVL